MATPAMASLYGWIVPAYIPTWDYSNPFNIMLLFLCLYSLVVNYCFGHPTFWRKSSYNSNLHMLGNQSDNSISVIRRKHATRVLDKLNSDLLHRVLGYFDPYELTVIRQVSRKYNAAAQNNKLWDDLSGYISEYDECRLDRRHPIINCPVVRYFHRLEQIMLILLEDELKLIVKLHNKLYDLTQFAAEHPGGGEILSEYKGKDATIVFDLASHSAFARQIGENLLLFDPAVYNGAVGMPSGVRRALQEALALSVS